MGLRMVEDVALANAITHGGTFHADDVLATVILSRVMDVRLARVIEVPEGLPEDFLIFDIGGGKYDHHQKDKEIRSNGIPFAACGLIWRSFGKRYLHAVKCPAKFVRRVFATIDKRFVQGIDAYDNGYTVTENSGIEKGLSLILGLFNPTWDEEVTADEAFVTAVESARVIFERIVKNYIAGVLAEETLVEAIKTSKNHTLVLDQYLPWKGILLNSRIPKALDIWYVVFPSNRGGFSCQCVPESSDSFEQRHAVPVEWRGAPEATGIEDCIFVHQTGFLASFRTKEGAIAYAMKALEMTQEE